MTFIKRTSKKHFSLYILPPGYQPVTNFFKILIDDLSTFYFTVLKRHITFAHFTFNLFLIINFKRTKNESKKHVKKQGKKTSKKSGKKDANSNVSTTKGSAGRPESGVIHGIRPRHRRDVIKQILLWEEKNYFLKDNPTSIKALAKWAYDHFDFKSEIGKKLSISTIEQLFGEIWREEHIEITTQKRAKKAENKKKKIHTN